MVFVSRVNRGSARREHSGCFCGRRDVFVGVRVAGKPLTDADVVAFDHALWEHIAEKQKRTAEQEAEFREWLAETYADHHVDRLREQFTADEIDLETFETQVALALRGYLPAPWLKLGPSHATPDAVLKNAYSVVSGGL